MFELWVFEVRVKKSKAEYSQIQKIASRELDGTPYVVGADDASCLRYERVRQTSREAHDIALRTQERIREQAGQSLSTFVELIRSDIVAESNRIEGYDWSTRTVLEVVRLKKELLSLPIRSFADAVRHDRRVFEALGLYKAHTLAEEWSESGDIPREADLRAFHSLIAAGEPYAGRYKTAENKIQGSALKTSAPWDVPAHMANLAEWWRRGEDREPVLIATVVHAWLTQIHPFDDGNGRLARLLANLALSQRKYPPLVLRCESDRGQYLDALAYSDQGDILPLYELFSRVTRRQVGLMGRHDYVAKVISDRLFSDVRMKREIWKSVAERFADQLFQQLRDSNWVLKIDGYPDDDGFHLLLRGLAAGGGWFGRCGPYEDRAAVLLWWGYQSDQMMAHLGDGTRQYPSIFVSSRFGSDKHPYKREDVLEIELQLRPMTTRPAILMTKGAVTHLGVGDGAKATVAHLLRVYAVSQAISDFSEPTAGLIE